MARGHLIDEDNACLLRARELEELPDHPRALAHVFLYQLGANDADEARVGPVGDGAGGEGLSSAGRTIEEHSLGRVDAELHEALGVQHG